VAAPELSGPLHFRVRRFDDALGRLEMDVGGFGIGGPSPPLQGQVAVPPATDEISKHMWPEPILSGKNLDHCASSVWA